MDLQSAIEWNRAYHAGVKASDARRRADIATAHAAYTASTESGADWEAFKAAMNAASKAHGRRLAKLRRETGRAD